MRSCPVCSEPKRTELWTMDYLIPDGWPLPKSITWHACAACGMLYGDGEFDQQMLDLYYLNYYGYGLQYEDNVARLVGDAERLAATFPDRASVIVDFGGAGDDGTSVLVRHLRELGYTNAECIGPGDPLPRQADAIFASHVLEHIYDLPETMERLVECLKPDGVFIADGPDSTGLALNWSAAILDFNTKHVNHFTLRDYLNLGHRFGLEMVDLTRYALPFVVAGVQVWFRQFDTGDLSRSVVQARAFQTAAKLRQIEGPVNVWGLSDASWHFLSQVGLDVLDFIDNDPAYRGKTYQGKPVLERPTNDAPILVMAQGQRKRLIENIRKAGITNEIVEA